MRALSSSARGVDRPGAIRDRTPGLPAAHPITTTWHIDHQKANILILGPFFWHPNCVIDLVASEGHYQQARENSLEVMSDREQRTVTHVSSQDIPTLFIRLPLLLASALLCRNIAGIGAGK